MGKGYRENADYFVEDGRAESRGGYARQKHKLTKGRAPTRGSKETSRHPDAHPQEPFSIPGPIGAGTETMRLAQQKRRAKVKRKERREETERLLSTTGAAAGKPERALPPASRQTLVGDLVRDISEHATIAGRAARELYSSVGTLLRAPGRLVRVIWHGQNANA